MMIGTIAVTAFLLASSPAERQAPTSASGRVDIELKTQPLFEDRRPRYSVLFEPAKPASKSSQVRIHSRTIDVRKNPRVVCGMVLIDADPAVDPKIAPRSKDATAVNPDPKIVRPIRQCADK